MITTIPLPLVLTADGTSEAVRLLRTYFGLDGTKPYAGASFERFAGGGTRGEVADTITSDDILSVALLSVAIPPYAILEITGSPKADSIGELLAQIPREVHLKDVDPADITDDWPASKLWAELRAISGVGPVTTSKLLARKRPLLLPVFDRVVKKELGLSNHFWAPLAATLAENDGALHRHLEQLRDESKIGEDISPLRVLDIVVWMKGTGTVGPDDVGLAAETEGAV